MSAVILMTVKQAAEFVLPTSSSLNVKLDVSVSKSYNDATFVFEWDGNMSLNTGCTCSPGGNHRPVQQSEDFVSPAASKFGSRQFYVTTGNVSVKKNKKNLSPLKLLQSELKLVCTAGEKNKKHPLATCSMFSRLPQRLLIGRLLLVYVQRCRSSETSREVKKRDKWREMVDAPPQSFAFSCWSLTH